jgi:poly(hydroxyalkanoate) granule-associated protein
MSRDEKNELLETGRAIWLAGLGALAEVEEGGRRVFDDLVERGRTLERQQLKAIDKGVARASDAAEKLSHQVRGRVQDGVSGVLHRANLPSRDDLKALAARLDRLSERVEALSDR